MSVCCDREIRKDGFGTSGWRQNGEKWTCPKCGRKWVHVCDEAEGCSWFPARRGKS